MSNNATYEIDPELIKQMAQQATQMQESLTVESHSCTDDEQVACALKYGPQAIDNKILISISENINTMAEAINESEKQKSAAREKYNSFFEVLLVFLIAIITILIFADTFWGIHVRLEFLISVLVAIIADVFAIVRALVEYMTSLEHYNAYNKLINSLLQTINHKPHNNAEPPHDSL